MAINPNQVNLGDIKIKHLYTCPPTVGLRDVVYLSSDDAVDKADADAGNPGIGLVASKPTSTTCWVVQSGSMAGFPPASFTAGETLYLGLAGAIMDVSGLAGLASGAIIQELAFAISDTEISILVDRDYTIKP
jgi:hypothetical protein